MLQDFTLAISAKENWKEPPVSYHMNDFYAIFLIFSQKGKIIKFVSMNAITPSYKLCSMREDVQYESGTSSVQVRMHSTDKFWFKGALLYKNTFQGMNNNYFH